MSDKNDLKPCPFCGGEAERYDFEDEEMDGDNFGGSLISCKRCQVSGAVHFDRKENLYSSWNDRASDKLIELSGRLEAAERTLTDARALAEKIRSNSCVAGYDCGHAGIEKIAKQLLAKIDRSLSPISQATEKT